MIKILILQNVVFNYRKSLYNELSKKYEVTVLHSGIKSVTKTDSYKEIIVPVKNRGPFYFQPGVLKEVFKDNYDVVIAMFDIRWIMNVLAVFVKYKKRFLYWGHRYSKNVLGNKSRDFLMRISDGVILYSNAEVDRIISRGTPESKIFIAQNTIDIPNFSDGSSSCKDSFIFSGRLQKSKRVDLLIQAFSEICDRIPNNVYVNIIGSGEEIENMKALAQRLGISHRIVFHGEIVDHGILLPLFHKAYAYVSPGPVGLGVLHSFSYGIPVVTNITGRHGPEYDDILDNYNSLTYKTYDELKEILIKFCEDKNLSVRLGKNAYDFYSKDRTLGIMIKGFINAIENRIS